MEPKPNSTNNPYPDGNGAAPRAPQNPGPAMSAPDDGEQTRIEEPGAPRPGNIRPRPTVNFPRQQGPGQAPQQGPQQTPQQPPRQAPRQQAPAPYGGQVYNAPGNNAPGYGAQGYAPQGYGAEGYGGYGNPPAPPRQQAYGPGAPKQGSRMPMIIGGIVGALLLLGGGLWYFFNVRQGATDAETADSIEQTEVDFSDNSDLLRPDAAGESAPEADAAAAAVGGAATTDGAATAGNASTAEAATGVSAGTEQTSLFNRPLTYTGTVTPGGAANLNIILFQNGRIEGSLDYSGGKSMPVYGSYTWTDNGHKMNVNLTVNSNSDRTYSESWSGSSSYIKDDLAHTLTFPLINTSQGQSMTASFALRP